MLRLDHIQFDPTPRDSPLHILQFRIFEKKLFVLSCAKVVLCLKSIIDLEMLNKTNGKVLI